jgi:hypothetical protein
VVVVSHTRCGVVCRWIDMDKFLDENDGDLSKIVEAMGGEGGALSEEDIARMEADFQQTLQVSLPGRQAGSF